MERYPDTKALDILLTQQLAKNPLLKDVVVCSVNPGLCRSELARDTISYIIREWALVCFTWLGDTDSRVSRIGFTLLARSTAEGAKTFVWASLSNEIPQGSYTSSCEVTKYVTTFSYSSNISRMTLILTRNGLGPTECWLEMMSIESAYSCGRKCRLFLSSKLRRRKESGWFSPLCHQEMRICLGRRSICIYQSTDYCCYNTIASSGSFLSPQLR